MLQLSGPIQSVLLYIQKTIVLTATRNTTPVLAPTQKAMIYPAVHMDQITFLRGPTQVHFLMFKHRQLHHLLNNRLQ